MSALPRNIAVPHRAAHRHNNAKKDAQDRQGDILPKTPRGVKQTGRTRADGQAARNEPPGQNLKQTDLVQFNQAAELVAVRFLVEHIQSKGPSSFNTACALIALELDVSTETAKRYLRKHSVDHPKAAFAIENGYVILRRAK